MKQVYVMLTCTGTGPSRMIKVFTHDEFTHSSLALTPSKHEFYSYARRRLHNCLVAGFIHEDTEKFVYALYPHANCLIYSIGVSDKAYEKMKARIAWFDRNYGRCTYNFIGAVTTWLGIKQKLKFKYTCAQFVASVLASSGEIRLPKPPSLIKPADLMRIKNASLVYSGELCNISFAM